MLCEWFHRRAAWPGHYNVVLHRTVTLFTLAAVLRHASLGQQPRLAAAFGLAMIFANVLYEIARRTCGTYAKSTNTSSNANTNINENTNRNTNVESVGWCGTCAQQRMERSHHCRVCNQCVIRFDHHCVYLNACIGAYNLRFFFAMLVCEVVHLGAGLMLLWPRLQEECDIWRVWTCSPLLSLGFVVLLVFFIAVVPLTLAAATRIAINKTTKEIVKPPSYFANGNRFDLGWEHNIAQCWEGYAHEIQMYKPISPSV